MSCKDTVGIFPSTSFDRKTELPRDDWYISAYDDKLKKAMGKQNLDFMIQRLNANAQPYYTLVAFRRNC